MDSLIIQTQFCHNTRAVALNKHIEIREHFLDDSNRPWVLQVHGHRLFTTVEPSAQKTFSSFYLNPEGAFVGSNPGFFDLDYIGAVIRQHTARSGAGCVGGEIQYLNTVQHTCHK